MLQETLALKSVLDAKEIPAWVDIWGSDVTTIGPGGEKCSLIF